MKPTVLIVDDEPNIRKMLRGVLQDEGFACADAVDVPSARECLASSVIDAILLDVNLPGQDGLALLRDADLPS
jgi:DNA-binding response OmpR family regulator